MQRARGAHLRGRELPDRVRLERRLARRDEDALLARPPAAREQQRARLLDVQRVEAAAVGQRPHAHATEHAPLRGRRRPQEQLGERRGRQRDVDGHLAAPLVAVEPRGARRALAGAPARRVGRVRGVREPHGRELVAEQRRRRAAAKHVRQGQRAPPAADGRDGRARRPVRAAGRLRRRGRRHLDAQARPAQRRAQLAHRRLRRRALRHLPR